MIFPPGCVESTPAMMLKRRKLNKADVQPVEGWRLVMSLRSGLLAESTWALDALNVLLYDDNAFVYFGLGNMPGLFEAVLEHWRAALIAMFNIGETMEDGGSAGAIELKCEEASARKRRRPSEAGAKRKWWQRPEDDLELSDEDEAGKEAAAAEPSPSGKTRRRSKKGSKQKEKEPEEKPDDIYLGRVNRKSLSGASSDWCSVLSGPNMTKRARFGD